MLSYMSYTVLTVAVDINQKSTKLMFSSLLFVSSDICTCSTFIMTVGGNVDQVGVETDDRNK